MQVNRRSVVAPTFTHEGARVVKVAPKEQLIRSVMSCMLWEDGFYEDGVKISDRIAQLVHAVDLDTAAAVAIEARENMKLRHVPLLITREMARHPKLSKNPRIVGDTLARVIQRADELAEFVAIYWKDGKQPLSKQVKLGLARAFQKFNEYELAKYNRAKDVRLKDVLFLCHSKPADVSADMAQWNKHARAGLAKCVGVYPQARYCASVRPNGFTPTELLYGKLIYDQLATPDTWEVELSAKGNNAETWTRLMAERKLGDLAFLRNLRNMQQAGVPQPTIEAYGDQRSWARTLPFRFLSAARMNPKFEPMLERWMFKCLENVDMLEGRTALLIDVSGSMSSSISAKSDLSRIDAAKALAILLRETCKEVDVFKFDTRTELVPARRGFALGDAIGGPCGGTDHRQAVNHAHATGKYDRVIILTDEQSRTELPRAQNEKGYIINVSTHQNGVGYGSWMHINGWSESVIDYIQTYERKFA